MTIILESSWLLSQPSKVKITVNMVIFILSICLFLYLYQYVRLALYLTTNGADIKYKLYIP
ncbi:hypothetical protein A9G39_06645 [Gilliamella sp. Imp1-6]|nr:hypothetical protein A9G39_06645 [Gilliamella apicola]